MHGFEIKVKKEQKYWIKLIQVLRCLIKVFRGFVSIESIVLTLSNF